VIKMCPGALRVFAPPIGAGDEVPQEKKAPELEAPLSPLVKTNEEV